VTLPVPAATSFALDFVVAGNFVATATLAARRRRGRGRGAAVDVPETVPGRRPSRPGHPRNKVLFGKAVPALRQRPVVLSLPAALDPGVYTVRFARSAKNRAQRRQ
jgi:hypothetical protein